MNPLQDKIAEFFSQYPTYIYNKNKTLFEPDKVPGILYVKNGFIRQYIISESGTELTVHIYAPASFFPIFWAVADIPNRFYFQALTQTEVNIAPKQKVLDFISSDPQISYSLIKRLSLGLDGLTKRLETIAFGNSYHRVISTIIYLSRHFAQNQKSPVVFKEKFTHQDIAKIVGITRERASLEIEKLIRKNLIIIKNQLIIIPDIEKLQKELHNSFKR